MMLLYWADMFQLRILFDLIDLLSGHDDPATHRYNDHIQYIVDIFQLDRGFGLPDRMQEHNVLRLLGRMMIGLFVVDTHLEGNCFAMIDLWLGHNSQQRRLSKKFELYWAGKSLSHMQFGLLMRNLR
jgi:hypothetical protein